MKSFWYRFGVAFGISLAVFLLLAMIGFRLIVPAEWVELVVNACLLPHF